MTPLEQITAQGQLALGDVDAPVSPSVSPDSAPAHTFTGEQLARRHPDHYQLFCRLFFEAGLGQMQAAKLVGISPQTAAAIIHREQSSRSADELRALQARRARSVVSLALGAIQERLSDSDALANTPLRDLVAVMQRAGDTALLLEGEATSRVVHSSGDADPESAARAYLAGLKSVEPAMDFPAQKIQSRCDAADGQADGCAMPPADAQADSESATD